jgi:hypothetical protein
VALSAQLHLNVLRNVLLLSSLSWSGPLEQTEVSPCLPVTYRSEMFIIFFIQKMDTELRCIFILNKNDQDENL